jgi:hypothetical protein
MKRQWPIVAMSVLALATIDAAYAGAKHRHHGARHVYGSVAPTSSFDQPRMYEARPGVWISTWDCITDEGYGRWRPCSSGGSRSR